MYLNNFHCLIGGYDDTEGSEVQTESKSNIYKYIIIFIIFVIVGIILYFILFPPNEIY